MFEMNEEAFSLLVGGFTGAEALRFREAYIVEFKRMQRALQEHVSQPQDFNNPALLRQLLVGYTYQLEASRAETSDERARRQGSRTA